MAVKRIVYCCNGDYIALIAAIAGIEPDYTIGLVGLFDTLNGAVT